MGRTSQLAFSDTSTRVAAVKRCTGKTAIPVADLRNDRVVPFVAAQRTPSCAFSPTAAPSTAAGPSTTPISSACPGEYRPLPDQGHYPQTNDICERFQRTMQDEGDSLLFRKKLYRTLEALQGDVDAWITRYTVQ